MNHDWRILNQVIDYRHSIITMLSVAPDTNLVVAYMAGISSENSSGKRGGKSEMRRGQKGAYKCYSRGANYLATLMLRPKSSDLTGSFR